MELIWIRHGMTKGNQEKRYIGGQTDEGLCEKGIEKLLEQKARGIYPQAEIVYVSPMKRCQETANLLYPDIPKCIVEGFRECDFGIFENKNAKELEKTVEYQTWLLGNGTAAFPGGESPEEFCRRSVSALYGIFQKERNEKEMLKKAAFVVHGGTIMAVFSALSEEKKGFYDYHTENGHGYLCEAFRNLDRLCLRHCRKL